MKIYPEAVLAAFAMPAVPVLLAVMAGIGLLAIHLDRFHPDTVRWRVMGGWLCTLGRRWPTWRTTTIWQASMRRCGPRRLGAGGGAGDLGPRACLPDHVGDVESVVDSTCHCDSCDLA
ncbi:MAG: hypothetical protein R2873_06345 [Caldilineaceae bacterium]